MPLPVAHSGAGLIAYLLFRKRSEIKSRRREILLVAMSVFLANLPDLDFLPGFWFGNASKFHHGPTHSLLFALIMAPIIYRIVVAIFKDVPKSTLMGICFVSLMSHVVLDYFSLDRGAPFGVPLFWPFLQENYTATVALFGDVVREDGRGPLGFLLSLINKTNGREVLVEFFFIGTLLSAVWCWKNRARPVSMLSTSGALVVCALLYYVLHIRSGPF